MRCISERVVGNVTVLQVATRAMLGDLTTELTERVTDLAAQGRRAFLLDLATVSSLDSHGLGDLVGAYEAATDAGGAMKLTRVHERVAHLLRVMNLDTKLRTFESEAAALESFEGA